MSNDGTPLHDLVMTALRAAGEPVREAALFERVRARGADATPERFIDAMEHLGSEGHVHVAFDHDTPARDPQPFQPRLWRVVE